MLSRNNGNHISTHEKSNDLEAQRLKEEIVELEAQNIEEEIARVSNMSQDIKDARQKEFVARINKLKKEHEVKKEVQNETIQKEYRVLFSREEELWAEQGKIAKESYDTSNAETVKDSYNNDYKEFNIGEKFVLSNKLKYHIDNVEKGERGNYRVPEPEKIKGVSVSSEGKVRIAENWKPGTDGAKPGTRHMEIVRAVGKDGKPTLIDRVGGENGNYFSPMNPEGKPYSLKERAIGDYLPEDNIQDNDSYHLYKVLRDFTRENFEKAIREICKSNIKLYNDMMDNLKAYYIDAISDVGTKGHNGEKYCNCSIEDADGVKTSEIDQMFLKDGDEYGKGTDGGGMQFMTPFSVDELKKMKMIEEI